MNAINKFDTLVAGELNIDLILNGMDVFPQTGKEILSKQMTLTLGSSSAIFASNLSSLGARVGFAGKTGKDVFGDLVLQSLYEKGVNTSAVIRQEGLHTGATVVLNYGDDRAMITHPGAMDQFTIADIPHTVLERARHLHFSSYFIQPGLRKDVGRLFRTAREKGLTTSFDTQWDPLEEWEIDLEGILPYVDIFLPNEKELLQLTRTTTTEQAIAAIEKFANTIVVKMGKKGSLLVHEGQQQYKPAFVNHEVVDAIGAGDSFNAGFIYRFLQKAAMEDCQEFGNLTGAISTTAPGGTSAFSNRKNMMIHAKERFGYAEKPVNG